MNAFELDSFSVAFAGRVVLDSISLALPKTGMNVLVGPSGGGKSTLLRTLAGANDGHTSMCVTGSVVIGGVRYDSLSSVAHERRPGLVRQNVKFLIDTVRENLAAALPNRGSLQRPEQDAIIVEHLRHMGLSALIDRLGASVADLPVVTQRLLALTRVTLTSPTVLLVDEVTAGLADADSELLLRQLRAQAERCAVVFVTHHQGHARTAGGTTYLLCGGRILSAAPTKHFFEAPEDVHARRFVETGGCSVAGDTVPADDTVDEASALGSEQVPPQAPPFVRAESAARGPRHFYWVVRGGLGGLPRPGIFQDVGHDLDGLERVRVKTLVTLEEWESVPRGEVEARGMALVHFPIDDMGAPSLEAAYRMCADVESRLRSGDVVALHCRAGNGRTGTMLAAQLIYQDTPACEALERVRSVNPKAVESDAQVRFLEAFERYVKQGAATV